VSSADLLNTALAQPIDRRAFLALTSLVLAGCSSESSPRLASPAAPLARGPQVAQVGETSAVVAWRSIDPALGVIEFGETEAYSGGIALPVPTTEHVVTLPGLRPGVPSRYRLRLGGEIVSEGHVFRTLDPAAPLRYAVFGDSGAPTWEQQAIARGIQAAAPDLVLHTGDVIYEDGALEELDPSYFLPFADLIDHIPFYPALGNHDVRTAGGRALLDALYLPTNDANFTERFYSFDCSDAHFVALNSNEDLSPGSLQHTWLERDLAAATRRWTFVTFHHPLYSSSMHGSDLTLRAALAPLFERYGVDVVFNGHDHNYERSLPHAGDAVVSAADEPDHVDPAGPVYIVTGAGGKSLHVSGANYHTAYSESVFHHVEVELQGTSLALWAVRTDGTVMDRMTITKTA